MQTETNIGWNNEVLSNAAKCYCPLISYVRFTAISSICDSSKEVLYQLREKVIETQMLKFLELKQYEF